MTLLHHQIIAASASGEALPKLPINTLFPHRALLQRLQSRPLLRTRAIAIRQATR